MARRPGGVAPTASSVARSRRPTTWRHVFHQMQAPPSPPSSPHPCRISWEPGFWGSWDLEEGSRSAGPSRRFGTSEARCLRHHPRPGYTCSELRDEPCRAWLPQLSTYFLASFFLELDLRAVRDKARSGIPKQLFGATAAVQGLRPFRKCRPHLMLCTPDP